MGPGIASNSYINAHVSALFSARVLRLLDAKKRGFSRKILIYYIAHAFVSEKINLVYYTRFCAVFFECKKESVFRVKF